MHFEIRDTIVSERNFREEVAVGKVIKSNPKYFYSYAKRFYRQKQSISMIFDQQKNICTDPEHIANVLQNQFQSVFSNPEEVDLTAADFPTPTIKKGFTDSDLTFSEEDVVCAIDDILTLKLMLHLVQMESRRYSSRCVRMH